MCSHIEFCCNWKLLSMPFKSITERILWMRRDQLSTVCNFCQVWERRRSGLSHKFYTFFLKDSAKMTIQSKPSTRSPEKCQVLSKPQSWKNNAIMNMRKGSKKYFIYFLGDSPEEIDSTISSMLPLNSNYSGLFRFMIVLCLQVIRWPSRNWQNMTVKSKDGCRRIRKAGIWRRLGLF